MIARFRPPKRMRHPRSMRKSAGAWGARAIILNQQSSREEIREQVIISLIQLKWGGHSLRRSLRRRLYQELGLPRGLAGKVDRSGVASVRCQLADMMIRHWVDPEGASKFVSYKQICCREILRKNQDLLLQPIFRNIDQLFNVETLEDRKLSARKEYNVVDVALQTGIPRETLYRYIRRGEIRVGVDSTGKKKSPITIASEELSKLWKLAGDLRRRAQKSADLKGFVEWLARCNRIEVRSAKRRLQRWKKSEHGRKRLEQELRGYLTRKHETEVRVD